MNIGENVHSGENESENKPESLTLGIVKDNWDSAHPGMVRVSISTAVDGEQESSWMPVASPYAGNECGLYMIPEIGSTVIIGYIDDNSVSPVVIGSIWSQTGKSNSRLPANTADKDNSAKVYVSSCGHTIKIDESKDSPKIEIITGKKQSITLDDKEMKVTVTSDSSKSTLILDGKNGSVSIKAESDILFNAGGKELLKLSKTGLEINSDSIKIKGKSLDINGNQTKISGSTIEVNAQGNLKVESSGIAQVKGSMLKLN